MDIIREESIITDKLVDIIGTSFAGKQEDAKLLQLNILLCEKDLSNPEHWILDGGQFSDRLSKRLRTEWGIEFKNVEMRVGEKPAEENKEYTEVIVNKVYYSCKPVNIKKEISHLRAKISTIPGEGKLKQEAYILDSNQILELPEERYNIGIGTVCRLSTGFRENQIVIDDDNSNDMFQKNRYVSRSHAFIKYSKQEGFQLFVEERGTRMAGKRTRIQRGSREPIDCINPNIPYPLKNGDIIELSKVVLLRFTIE